MLWLLQRGNELAESLKDWAGVGQVRSTAMPRQKAAFGGLSRQKQSLSSRPDVRTSSSVSDTILT